MKLSTGCTNLQIKFGGLRMLFLSFRENQKALSCKATKILKFLNIYKWACALKSDWVVQYCCTNFLFEFGGLRILFFMILRKP